MSARALIPVASEPPLPAAGCDCSRCDFYIHNPDAREPVCSGSNTDCDYCGCGRAGEATELAESGCYQCSIRCGSRVDIAAWMTDIGSTVSFDDIDLRELELTQSLPAYIPQVDTKDLTKLNAALDWPAYAIGLRRVVSDATYAMLPGFTGRTAHDALGLNPDQAAVLVGYGLDPLVEAVWTRKTGLIQQLAAQQWDLVLAPNFSAYGNFPRAEMLINMRRNLVIAQEMIDNGIPAVPNIYSMRLEDLERIEAWLQLHRPPAIACNLQTQRTDDAFFEQLLPGLTYLAHVLPAETRFIATGSSRRSRITQLQTLFGDRLTLVSQNAIQYARHGAVMTAEGRQNLHAETAAAFAANVRFYASLVDEHPAAAVT